MSENNRNYLPDCWSNSVRMNSLMLEFRPKNVNPFGYEEKMSFWKESILRWSRSTKKVIFTQADACKAFERNGHQPECLGTVFDDMRRQEMLITTEQFSSDEKSWVGWTMNVFVKKPLSWAWTSTLNILNWNTAEQKFINFTVLKEMTRDVLLNHHKNVSSQWLDHIIPLDDLWKQCKSICGNKDSFQLVIQQLEKEKQIYVFNVDGKKIVKFKRIDELIVTKPTEVEIELRRMQQARDFLEVEIDKLEKEIESKRNEAKFALVHGQKDKAALLVKKKKRLESVLKTKIAALDNLENLFTKLQESKSEKAVFQAYQAGVLAFRKVYKEGEFSLDKVDTTMTEIEEVLEDQNAIETALSKPIGFDADLNIQDSDLELELEEILETEKSLNNDMNVPGENIRDVISKLKVHGEEPSILTEKNKDADVIAI